MKVFVDGAEVEADPRDNLIEAARRIGVAIPYFCYHPRLSIAGQCRMCLVETSDAPGRLVPGCQVRVKEGLKVTTTSPAVKENQRGCMEFHLVNHPVDCAICDQSGECKLQDYYMDYDHQPSRIRTYKPNKPKREVFGPMVVYDAERCIMCTRCVRFMDEIAREPQLAVVQRGSHSLISTFPGQPLDSKYSGNTVDICPVGALLNRDLQKAVDLLKPIAGQPGIGIAVSAQCTNEEAAAAFLLGQQLKAERYFLGGNPPGDHDDFLVRGDKNPNTRGVQLAAHAFGVKLEEPSALAGVKALI